MKEEARSRTQREEQKCRSKNNSEHADRIRATGLDAVIILCALVKQRNGNAQWDLWHPSRFVRNAQ